MPENDQYPQHRRDTKKPVTVMLLVAIAAAVALFLYQRSDAIAPKEPTPTAQPTSANPNILVPPGSGSQSPRSP